MTDGLKNGQRILVHADAVSMHVGAGHSLLRIIVWLDPVRIDGP
jgi:hypothetical protein